MRLSKILLLTALLAGAQSTLRRYEIVPLETVSETSSNVEAPGVIYFNNGTGKRYTPQPFGDGRGQSTAWPRATSMATAGRRSWSPSFVMFNRPR